MVASHDFLLALTEPSRQIKVSPWQWSIPPFRPLHGVFADAGCKARAKSAISVTTGTGRNFRSCLDICLATPGPWRRRAASGSADERNCQAFSYQCLANIPAIDRKSATAPPVVALFCSLSSRPTSARNQGHLGRLCCCHQFLQSRRRTIAQSGLSGTTRLEFLRCVEADQAYPRAIVQSYRIPVGDREFRFASVRDARGSVNDRRCFGPVIQRANPAA